MWKLAFTARAREELERLRADRSRKLPCQAVERALGKLQSNPRRPGLATHEYKGEKCPHGGKLFEAYAQNQTPGAYRVFWCYVPPPPADTLLIVAITPHP